MLKVLFIEDEPTSIETVIEELEQKIKAIKCEVKKFRNAKAFIRSFSPDIVVLDIFRGSIQENETAGLRVYESIWNERFCPIVIYSARPNDISDEVKEHPFIQLVQKGAGSEESVISHIESFLPHVEAIHEIQNNVRECMNRELKETAPRVFQAISDTDKRRDVFIRTSRRRIAAMMDQPPDEPIACWEQYLYPPVGSSLMTGDIIRKKTGDKNTPGNYFVVLTPSCDLVGSRARKPSVASVLVAYCTQVESVLRDAQVDRNTKMKRFKEKLLLVLTRGYGSLCLPLPELPGVFPYMTVELKKLELINLKLIGKGTSCKYFRVASVDSPFREMISWAYLQVTGRPGLPDRDLNDWADHIYRTVSQSDQGVDA